MKAKIALRIRLIDVIDITKKIYKFITELNENFKKQGLKLFIFYLRLGEFWTKKFRELGHQKHLPKEKYNSIILNNLVKWKLSLYS